MAAGRESCEWTWLREGQQHLLSSAQIHQENSSFPHPITDCKEDKKDPNHDPETQKAKKCFTPALKYSNLSKQLAQDKRSILMENKKCVSNKNWRTKCVKCSATGCKDQLDCQVWKEENKHNRTPPPRTLVLPPNWAPLLSFSIQDPRALCQLGILRTHSKENPKRKALV